MPDFQSSKILVDYLSFTLTVTRLYEGEEPKDGRFIPGRVIKKVLLLDGVDMLSFFMQDAPGCAWQQRRGLYGYECSLWYDGIVVCWGRSDTVLVQMSGTGCRTWESLHAGLSWEKYIAFLYDRYLIHISRLDIAYDTFGLLKLRTIQQYTRDQRYISRWKTYLIQEGTSENSVIWGSGKSDFRLRIYDKSQERSVKGGIDPAALPAGWVRCEFQLRDDAAAVFWREWQRLGNLGLAWRGIMTNQLIYVKSYDGRNRTRAQLAPWWRKLLDDAPRIRLCYTGGKEYNFDKLLRYAHQYAPSAKALIECCGGDPERLLKLIEGSRLSDRQAELVRSHLLSVAEDIAR